MVEIKSGHIAVRGEDLDDALKKWKMRMKYPAWLSRVSKKDRDVLLALDRASSPAWLALSLGRKEPDILKSLDRLNTKAMVDCLDGFWYRSALGEGVVIDCQL
jgi:hypothetical protein